MLSTKYLPHSGTQCFSFTSYLNYIIYYISNLSIYVHEEIHKIAPVLLATKRLCTSENVHTEYYYIVSASKQQ